MKKAKRIGGFGVEILESVRDGRVWFSARIIDPYISGPSCAPSEEAYAALALKWESVKTAYRNSNLPIPKPPRSRGNKRMLEMLRKLASRPFPTTIV
jgi:hypothetical protein